MSVTKLSDYKIAKQFEKDYKHISKVLDLTIRGLSNFKQYKPVVAVLHELNNQKSILELHLKTAKRIMNHNEEVK